MKPARELAARALCRRSGNSENIKFEGKPMWMSFLDDADAVLKAIEQRDSTENARLREALDRVIATDQMLGCTATSKGRQVWHDGPCAEIARAALKGEG